MISDIGTKPLTSTRILALKREMGMWVEAEQIKDERAEEDQKLLGEGAGDAFPCEVDGERTVLEDLSAHERGIRAERVLRLLAIAAVLQVGRGEDPVEPSGEGRDVFSFEMFLVFYTLVVIMISIVATWAWLRKSGRGSSSASSSDPVAIEESVPERLDEVEKDAPDALGEESMVEKADGGSGHGRKGDGSAEPSGRGGDGIQEPLLEAVEVPPQRHGVPRPRWRGEIEIRGRSIQSQRTFPVFLTRFGDRYHDLAECSSLSQSTLRRSAWCRECLAGLQRWGTTTIPPLWSRGPGQMVHLERDCDPDLRRYEHCRICERGGR